MSAREIARAKARWAELQRLAELGRQHEAHCLPQIVDRKPVERAKVIPLPSRAADMTPEIEDALRYLDAERGGR